MTAMKRSLSVLCQFAMAIALSLSGCAVTPLLREYPASTPDSYTENKAFFLESLQDNQFNSEYQAFRHLYEVDPRQEPGRLIKPLDPLSVILQGVRLPEDLGSGTRDVAVVLDINTSSARGLTSLVAFYQRNVPAGQMLNFNNLLVYADPMWDSASPPYFRIRVIDVKAERNTAVASQLARVANLGGQISGVVPHPAIPVVNSAIETAGALLSNRKNRMILDFQVQFYGAAQVQASGGAAIGVLCAGPWLVLGRERGGKSDFWRNGFVLERRTDRIGTLMGGEFSNIAVPYVALALVRADAEVPKLVLDRSEALVALLSTPAGKADVDALESAAAHLSSAIDAFTVERRLSKYRSILDVEGIINKLKDHVHPERPKLNDHELRRLIYVLNRVTNTQGGRQLPKDWITWWDAEGGDNGRFESDDTAPLGFVFKPGPIL